MYHVLKKYRRRLLAIFTAALMVAFLIPTIGRMGRTADTTVRGRLGKEKLYASDYQAAQREFELLSRYVFVSQNGRAVPVMAAMLGGNAMLQMSEHSELYLLLQREARRSGFVPPQRVQELYEQCQVRVADADDPGMVETVKHALASLMMIQGAFRDAASTIKISAPYRDYEVATRSQEMKVAAVEFDGAEFLAQVPSPTQPQLEELYNRYADIDAETQADVQDNPFGIGYRFPHRVKLQYICIPHSEVRKSIEAEHTPYDWDVAAFAYYRTHSSEFTSTTRPAGASTTAPTTRMLRPFAEVHQEALEAIIAPDVDRRQTEIQRHINAVMTEDYAAFKDSATATRPSSLKVAYNDYAYLQKLAADLQQRFHVTARVEALGTLQSRLELARNESLAKAVTSGGISLPSYATLTPADYEKLQKRIPALPRPLKVYQPSQSLNEDDSKDLYYFRLVEIDAARKAHGLAEVKDQVTRDWRLIESVKRARKAAEDFIASARGKDLDLAAKAAKKLALKSDFFVRGRPILGLHLEDALAERFASQAAKLLAMKAAGDQQPMAVIELAREGRVFATRLEEVRSQLNADQRAYMDVLETYTLQRDIEQRLRARWFDYANVIKRLSYAPVGGGEENAPVAAPEPENPADEPQL